MQLFTKILDALTSSTKYKSYNDTYKKFQTSVNNFITKLTDKLNKLTTKTVTFDIDSGQLDLKDNTVFKYTGSSGITTLTLNYPQGDFISTVLFSTAASGSITVQFDDDTVFVGRKKLEFFPQETWELNIHNKRVVAVQIFEQ